MLDLHLSAEEHLTQDRSSEDLLYGYMLSLSGRQPETGHSRGSDARSVLDVQARKVYDALKEAVLQIAAGQRDSSVIGISLSELGYPEKNRWTAEDLGVPVIRNGAVNQAATQAFAAAIFGSGIDRIVFALQADCPYELFWFDKVQGYLYSLNGANVGYDQSTDEYYFYFKDPACALIVQLKVAQAYQNDGLYVPDAARIATVSAAAGNAGRIVQAHLDDSDLRRLTAYKDVICDLVSYDAAAEEPGTPYGDPWQLIYVFDDDPDTNVVCEGYAKAFQYLFDLSYDENAPLKCRTVTGSLQVGRISGNHMWNLVRMEDGKTYVADLTNCDSEKWGYPDQLFLKSMIWLDEAGLYYFHKFPNASLMYAYNEKTINLWGAAALSPATTDYGAEDVTDAWLGSWTYEVENGTCVLLQHISYETYVVVPSQVVLHGNVLDVVVRADTDSSGVFSQATQRLYIQKDVGIQGNILAGLNQLQVLHLAGDTLPDADMTAFFQDCASLAELQLTSAFLTPASVFPAAHGHHADRWYSVRAGSFLTVEEILNRETEGSDTFLIYDAVYTAPQYVWSEDGSAVLAYHTHRYTNQPETETVQTSAAVYLEPTCTDRGSTRYVAAFREEAFGTQERILENLDALGHDPVRAAAVPATLTEDGLSAGVVCTRCDTVLEGCAGIDHTAVFRLPASLTVIEEEAFSCTAASQIMLSDQVTKIGSRAFAGCEHLAVIRIPAGVTRIEKDAFEDDSLLTLWVDEDSYAWDFAGENGFDRITGADP